MERHLKLLNVPTTVVPLLCSEETTAVKTPVGVSILYDLALPKAALYSMQYSFRK